MPDISGATVFDDLPESIITREIFFRLQTKDVLLCGAVSRSWRAIITSKEFRLDHHRHQPPLPLLAFCLEGKIDVFDIREAPAKRRPLLGYNTSYRGSTLELEIHASCDGLLLVSRENDGFNIVNPTTRQWLALPWLTKEYGINTGTSRYVPCITFIGAEEKIVGMYPDPHGSGEYRILFRRGETTDRNASYYILAVGSSQKDKKPKCIGPSVASGIPMYDPPVLLNGCLHWIPRLCPEDGLLVFDTAKESFRWMSLPVRSSATLLPAEGMLSVYNFGKIEMEVWVLQDYEREGWSLKCKLELPIGNRYFWRHILLSHKKDMLIYTLDSCLHQLHYDDGGKLLEEFQWEIDYYRNITRHWFKESLVKHSFFCKAWR